MEYPKFKVCVRCFTYNQSKYITDALNGFVMQQTDFPFVCCIVDDASTDGEQDAIKKYVEDNFDLSNESCHFDQETDYAFITYAQHKTNKNCYFAVLYLKENHYSTRKTKMPYLAEWRDMCEYEAICEGDDYWISSNRLQLQNDILDKYNDLSCCTGGYLVFKSGRFTPQVIQKDSNGFRFQIKDYVRNWITQPLTCMYRISALSEYNIKKSLYQRSRDTHLFYHLLKNGDGYYFSKPLGVYRINNCGIFSMRGSRVNDIIGAESWKELYEQNDKDPRLKSAVLYSRCVVMRRAFIQPGERLNYFVKTFQYISSIRDVVNIIRFFLYGFIKKDRSVIAEGESFI